MSLISTSPTLATDKQGASMQQKTAVGSGSRPTPSRVKIETSAPENAHTLGRAPSGALK